MPKEGESFAGALDSLEARCRSETRLLYESEGKEELLGESGVPESLRVWLEESRGRALDDGGHRERARRRLRKQVRAGDIEMGSDTNKLLPLPEGCVTTALPGTTRGLF